MSRYIDADALIKNLDDAIQDAKRKNEIGDYWEDDRSNLLYYLDNAPTIDAVEVVRCKECKWRKACKVFSQQQITDDSYCSWGESAVRR